MNIKDTQGNAPDTRPLSEEPLLALLQSGQVVDGSVLDHRQEDEDEADPQVNVHGLDVGHPGHGGVDSGDDGGHGEHRGDTWGNRRHFSCQDWIQVLEDVGRPILKSQRSTS